MSPTLRRSVGPGIVPLYVSAFTEVVTEASGPRDVTIGGRLEGRNGSLENPRDRNGLWSDIGVGRRCSDLCRHKRTCLTIAVV